MSGKICVNCKLRDRKILADTLEKMNLKGTTAKDGTVTISRNYQPMIIGVEEISCDSMDRSLADSVKVQYQKGFQLNQLALTGEQYEVVEASDKISIYVF
jgi:hypothetical protein